VNGATEESDVVGAVSDHGETAAVFVTDVAVRFSDRDAFGHVNHTCYLVFCEEHRNNFFALWLRECGVDMLDSGFVVARVECDYFSPIGRDERLVRVEMTVEEIGRTSVRLRYRIVNGPVLAALIQYVLVLIDRAGRPRAVNKNERQLLMRFHAPV
jgi:acyl-CoA thioester hydrolase